MSKETQTFRSANMKRSKNRVIIWKNKLTLSSITSEFLLITGTGLELAEVGAGAIDDIVGGGGVEEFAGNIIM